MSAAVLAGDTPSAADGTTGDPAPLTYRSHLPAISHDAAVAPGAERNCAVVGDEQIAPSSPEVETRLMKPADLGPGWAEWTGDDDDEWVWFYRPARLPGELATAWSPYWEKGGAGIDERLTLFDTPGRAAGILTEALRSEACIVANINAGKPNANTKGWTFSNARSEHIVFPALGEGAVAFRLTYDFSCGPGCAETDTQFRVYVLTGKYIAQIHLYGYDTGEELPISAAEFEGIVARAIERASQ